MPNPNYQNKKVAIVGLGRTGLALAEYLLKRVSKLYLLDHKQEVKLPPPIAKSNHVVLGLGDSYLDAIKKCDIAFVSPGVPHEEIEKIPEVKKGKVKLSSDVELLFYSIKNKIVGVTGSNGKTTTVSLIDHILSFAKVPHITGGNIGDSLIDDIGKIKPKDIVLLELSSFQLEFLDKSPDIAVVLNISPNHLDRHMTVRKYIDSKMNIVKHQKQSDTAVLNQEDAEVAKFAKKTRARVAYFAISKPEDKTYFLRGNNVFYLDKKDEQLICSIEDFKLTGDHNKSNLLAAIAVVRNLGVKNKDIERAIKSFRGLEHRVEFVGIKRGVEYFNDSKATTPHASIAALNSFGKKVILIAGGSDKGLDYEELAVHVVRQAKKTILLGETGPKIEKAILDKFPEYEPNIVRKFGEPLESAVRKASKLAIPGDIVLLSPASASFDQFVDYEERGQIFKKLVK